MTTNAEMATIHATTLDLLSKVAEDATGLLECNCSYTADADPDDHCDGSCTYSMAVRALAALKEGETSYRPAPVWWVVTLREDGDDEDSLYIVQPVTDDATTAEAAAREAFLRDVVADDTDAADACRACGHYPCQESCGACDYPRTIYVNHVVRCGSAQPEHVRTAP
jgi:hypothetical protein